MEEWLEQLWQNLTAVSLPLLLLGLALQTAQTCLVALAWRNILRAAYPEGGVTYDETLSYYAGGVGLNAFLPAGAGTVAMVGLFRTSIGGATVAGLVGAAAVENIFFAAVATCLYLWLFLGAAGSLDITFDRVGDHGAAWILIVAAGVVLVALVIRILWRRAKETWEN